MIRPVGAPIAVRVEEPTQVGELRRAASALALRGALPEECAGRAALVATELGTNLVRHGRGGTGWLQHIAGDGADRIEIVAADAGPGIPDVARALRDGFTTGTTPGTGLGAVQRASNEFEVHTVPGRGTVIVSRIGGPAGKPSVSGLQTAMPGEEVCGDAWIAHRGAGGVVTVLVADGLGHGPSAADAAREATRVFERGPDRGLGTIMERLHAALRPTRGAAVALLRSEGAGRLSFCGVGNVAATVFGASERHALLSSPGTVGHHMGRIREVGAAVCSGDLIVLHTDGVSARWTMADYPGLRERAPGIVAATLLRDHGRGRDDATVVGVRCA